MASNVGRGTTKSMHYRSGPLLLQRLQLLARFETHGFARRDSDLGAGTRVAADSGLAGSHVENAEATQLDALTLRQCAFHALENRFDGHLGFGFRNPGLTDHFIDDVEFDQSAPSRRSRTNAMKLLLEQMPWLEDGSKPHRRIRVSAMSSMLWQSCISRN